MQISFDCFDLHLQACRHSSGATQLQFDVFDALVGFHQAAYFRAAEFHMDGNVWWRDG